MTIDEIKSVSIVQFLETEGFQYAYIHRGNYWYLSPFRAESSPSFNVSPTKNLWNDFGANSGGNIINLVQKMHPSWNNHQVLTYLEQQIKSHNLKYAEDYEAMTKEQQRINRWNQSQIAEKMKESKSITFIDRICKLSHPNLKSYISQRRVDFEVAQDFCKEIHYHINDKHYYAIAFENIDGGMEIRNKYCKRSIGKKTISIIRTNGESHPECCIFEGLFDMLTYASLKKWMMDIQLYIECECDYIGKVVRKDLAFLVKGGLPVPTYVLEYLLGQYCASDDEEIINEGLEKVKDVIKNNYVHRAEAESVKGLIREHGKHRIIDKVTVVLNEKNDEYQATFANLGLSGVPIGTDYVRKNPKLLSGNGVWCIVTIGYISGEDVKVRWEIQTLKPIQISNIDLQEYIEQRKNFTTEEWIDLLMHTVGLNPDTMNRREKFITLARLLPHVENNFNFMELGPKGTGKSHVFQELSPYGVLVSGGDVTSARLFVRMSGKREELGLVGYWDVVAWDEFEQQKGRAVDAVLIDTMQNYLANKSFNRGKGTHEASASMVFVGNTKHTVPFMLKNTHLFESIPTSFIKGAFLDRIHLYNPGWEIKMLKKDSFSKGYGLITDYIAAVLHAMRNDDRTAVLKDYAKFDGSLSERDHLAIRKTFSGMMKLLYPDGKMTDQEAYELVDFAAESRKRVKDQLYVIDETFKAEPAHFKYINLRTGIEMNVETLEKVSNPLIIPINSTTGTATGELTDADAQPLNEEISGKCSVEEGTTAGQTAKRPRIHILQEKSMTFRMGQTGVSYEKLFASYMANANEITVEDPYIRAPWQIKNFMEFALMLINTRPVDDLKLNLITNEEDDKLPELIDRLDDIKDDLATYGIDFEYKFRDFHDRCIKTDTGWTISLGRGLDMFEKYNTFSIASSRQDMRKCKEFTVTFMKTKNA
jgi:ATP-dependent Lon protease